MNIRLERPEDYSQVENLVREAFWNVYAPGCCEHYILHQLRRNPCYVPELSYVVEEQGRVVAQIAYAKGTYRPDSGGEEEMLLFGPVGVLPEEQGKGYGSALIRFTLERARELGWPLVAITGNPAYYSRFGFEPASRYGVYHKAFGREEAPVFQLCVLDPGGLPPTPGWYEDPACYEAAPEEVEAFDRQFPPKRKEVLPGQLSH